ncbi:Scr1 family TA system antitoxin-like transcriptional regulator [Nocardia fluminea]|uniref:Scr1 family TA system antitoxin-like transcriptional regulator n=1 Tax=Nocardia fluminea TaxID=134984 RepID=UPI00366C4A29
MYASPPRVRRQRGARASATPDRARPARVRLFHMLIDEAALRVTVGSSEVMTTQIRHLMNILTAREHVRIGIALNAKFLAPADSFDFSYATDSDNKRITDPFDDADIVEPVERTFDLLATTTVYGEEAHAILVRALASHTESGI